MGSSCSRGVGCTAARLADDADAVEPIGPQQDIVTLTVQSLDSEVRTVEVHFTSNVHDLKVKLKPLFNVESWQQVLVYGSGRVIDCLNTVGGICHKRKFELRLVRDFQSQTCARCPECQRLAENASGGALSGSRFKAKQGVLDILNPNVVT
jgi:hypothetical protein